MRALTPGDHPASKIRRMARVELAGPQRLFLGRCLVGPGPRPATPTPAAGPPDATPSGGRQRRARLRAQGVGDDPPIPEGLGRPRGRPVEHRGGVLRAVGAAPRHFQRQAVIEVPRNRPADGDDADDPPGVSHRDAEFPALGWEVVPVMPLDEAAGFRERDGDEREGQGRVSRCCTYELTSMQNPPRQRRCRPHDPHVWIDSTTGWFIVRTKRVIRTKNRG